MSPTQKGLKTLLLALVAVLGCTAAIAADAPAKTKLKAGWDGKQIKVFAHACTVCIANRVAETWTMAEMGNNLLMHSQPMVDEAIQGGRCKPDGLLGDILKQKKMARP